MGAPLPRLVSGPEIDAKIIVNRQPVMWFRQGKRGRLDAFRSLYSSRRSIGLLSANSTEAVGVSRLPSAGEGLGGEMVR